MKWELETQRSSRFDATEHVGLILLGIFTTKTDKRVTWLTFSQYKIMRDIRTSTPRAAGQPD